MSAGHSEDAATRASWTSISRQSRLAAATRHLRSVGLPEHEAARLVRSAADELPVNDALKQSGEQSVVAPRRRAPALGIP